MVQAQTEQELGLSLASILFSLFLGVGGLVAGWWVLKLKLMLTPKLVGVGAGAELGKISATLALLFCRDKCSKKSGGGQFDPPPPGQKGLPSILK